MHGARRTLLAAGLAAGLALAGLAGPLASAAHAASAEALAADGMAALSQLEAQESKTIWLSQHARAILVFPKIIKAGFMIGAETGDGVLLVGGQPAAYYSIKAGSYGLQAGVQSYSYALFFMKDSALDYLKQSDGWAIGAGPSVVVMDKGKAMSTTSTTLTQDVVAVPFGEKGLMAGMGLEGSKISPIHPD